MSNTQVPERRVLWMPLDVAWRAPSPDAQFCCRAMSSALEFGCDQHADPFDCGDALVVYNEVFDEYGLIVHDGGASYVLIAHCPWCGSKLPESQRDRWFDETDAIIERSEAVPARFHSIAWRTPPAGAR